MSPNTTIKRNFVPFVFSAMLCLTVALIAINFYTYRLYAAKKGELLDCQKQGAEIAVMSIKQKIYIEQLEQLLQQIIENSPKQSDVYLDKNTTYNQIITPVWISPGR